MRFEPTSQNLLNHDATQKTCTGLVSVRATVAVLALRPIAQVGSFLLRLLAVAVVLGSVAQAQTIRQNGALSALPPWQLTSNTGTQAGLNGVTYVKVGPDGSIYVADTNNDRILKYVPTTVSGYASCPGGILSAAPAQPYITAQTYCQYLLVSPGFQVKGIAVDSANDLYFVNYNGTAGTYAAYFYLQYLGVPSGTSSGNGYNGYGCTSSSATTGTNCRNYVTISTTTPISSKAQGMFVDSYGTVFIAEYTTQLVQVERPLTAVTPGTVPPTAASSYTEMTISGAGYPQDVTEDQWGNIIIAAYSSGTFIIPCGTGSSCTQSTSSFTGAKTSAGNGYGATAGTGSAPATLAAGSTAYPAGTKISSATSAEGCDGVALDTAGNLYASFNDHSAASARIYQFPLMAPGTYSTTGFDVVASLTAPTGTLAATLATSTVDQLFGMAFDPTHPNVLYIGSYLQPTATNSSILQLTLSANGYSGAVNLGSSPLGTPVTKYLNLVATSSTAATSIYAVTLNSSTSDSAVSTSPATTTANPFCNVGATLAGSSAYNNAGGGCVVGITFTPTHVGTEFGAVIFASSTAVLGWGYLEGTGLGAVATFQTPVEKTVASGLVNAPTGLALDNAGNLYYAATAQAYITQLAAGTWTATDLNDTTALSAAKSLTIDGAGILYVADSSNAHIQKFLPNLADSLTGFTQSSLSVGTAPTAANGVFVDPYGNIYIANTGANQIQIEPWNGVNAGTGWGTEVVLATTPGLTISNLSAPKAVVVDGSGNLFVADSGNGRVIKYTLTTAISNGALTNTYAASLITATTTNPTALALDANGDAFIADAGTNKIYKEAYSAGSYTESIIPTSTLSGPSGIVVAPNGNIFIADTGNNRILEEDVADAPTVSFGSIQQGVASTQLTATLVNEGNVALSIAIPGSGNNPTLPNADYSLYSSGGTDCPLIGSSSSSAGTVAAGASCLLPITFTPSIVGSDPGTLIITDNSNTATTTTQTITLTGTGTAPLTGFSFTLAATNVGVALNVTITAQTTGGVTDTGYTGTVSFSSSDSGATLPGSYTFVAGDAGVHTFSITFATPGSQSVTVKDALTSLTATQSTAVTGPQTISFTAPATETYGVAPVTLSATATSGLPVTFSITSGSSFGALSGTNNSILTITGAGVITIAANQSGNTYYTAAPQVTQTITIGKEAQTISFTAPSSETYGAISSLTLSATATSGLAVSFSVVSGPGNVSGVNGSTLTITGGGTIVVAANQAGNSNYAAAVSVQQSIVVAPEAQTISSISGLPLSANTGSAGPYTLSATATSGLPVSFSILSGSSYGSLSGTNNSILTVNPTAVGSITIAANQAGNSNYLAAPQVVATIVISNLISQAITFSALTSPVTYGVSPITLSATGGASGNPVVFSILSGTAGSLSGPNNSTLTITGVGSITIAANQAGNSTYAVAAQVTQTLVVNQATQSLSAISGLPASAVYGAGPYTLSASGGASGSPVIFSILSGSAIGTLSGTNNSILTITGVGSITVAANQAGTANYSAASQVTATIVVSQATQTLSAISGLPATAIFGAGSYTLSATGGASGNPVTFSITSGGSYGTLSGTNNSILTITGAGNIIIAANQAGTANYSAASQVTATIVVSQAVQTLSAISGLPATAVYGAGPYTLSATGGASGNPVTFSITSGGSFAALSGTNNSILTITGAGSITVAANQAGTANYSAATQVTATIVVSQIAQTITFTSLPTTGVFGLAGPYTLTATGGASGNPVTFSILSGSGSATLSGTNNSTLTITGAGSITIAADQAGNTNYAAAPEVTQTIVISAGTQTITFPNPGSQNYGYGIAPITLTATASSGLPVIYTVTSGPATVNGSVLTITAPGQMIIMATQPGNAYYSQATPVSISFSVIAPDFSVAVTSPSPVSPILTIMQGATGSATFAVTPIGGFNQTVQYSCSGLPANSTCTFNPNSAAVSGSVAVGTMTISTVPQDGNLAELHTGKPFSLASFLLPGGLIGAALLFLLRRQNSHKVLQKLAQLLLVIGFLGVGISMTGCGVNNVPPVVVQTPTGSSTITITAATSAAGGTSHAATFTLVIAAR